MLSLTLDTEEFASRRRQVQSDLEATLVPLVRTALTSKDWGPVLDKAEDLFQTEFASESGFVYSGSMKKIRSQLQATLDKGDYDRLHSVNETALWLATAVLTQVSIEAAVYDTEDVFLEWVTMHDSAVRHTHRHADGQVRPPGEKFDVGGSAMIGPGDVTAPVAEWINCRCALRPVLASEMSMTAAGGTMDNARGVPWHGVLAPEGVWSGDKRMFAEGALSWRPLPLPLTWQKQSADGHGGNITVARIEGTFTDPDTHLVWGWGHTLLTVPEADEWVGLLAEFGKFGVSVDADSTTFELDEEADGIVFTAARGSSACTVAIPAFSQAFVSLGNLPPEVAKKIKRDPEDEMEPPEKPGEKPDAEDVAEGPEPDPEDQAEAPETPGEKPDAEDKAEAPEPHMPVHVDTIPKEVIDSLPPEVADEIRKKKNSKVAASITMDRGAGWVTNPIATKRIHDYWTVPGQPGYDKVAWGTDGDFNRCRVEIGQEIAEKTPEKLRFINAQCAQWQHDAIGIWPGKGEAASLDEPGARERLERLMTAPVGPALSLVAGGGFCAPSEWFKDPKLTDVTPMTITDDGHVFGHLAFWDSCHLDSMMAGICTAPPHSLIGYADFLTGHVKTDTGGIVPTGPISIGGGHAGPRLSMRAAIEHYDSTSSAVADVTVGEDAHGIWYNGWIRPGTSDEQITALRASAVSGDWREHRGNLEMIAVLAVNTPGFGIPRVRAAVDGERQVSLVASGVVTHAESSGDLGSLVAAEVSAALERRAEMDRIAATLEGVV